MTTTIMFSGKEGKNSSKVLAPPGGRSSNIFGFAEETPAPAQAQRKTPAQSPFAQDATPNNQDTAAQRKAPSQSPFAQDSPCEPTTQRRAPSQAPFAQDSPGPAKPFKPVSTFSLSGSPSPAQQQQQQQTQNTSPQQQQEAAPQQPNSGNPDNKTSIKIYNPPGGRSSIQF